MATVIPPSTNPTLREQLRISIDRAKASKLDQKYGDVLGTPRPLLPGSSGQFSPIVSVTYIDMIGKVRSLGEDKETYYIFFDISGQIPIRVNFNKTTQEEEKRKRDLERQRIRQ